MRWESLHSNRHIYTCVFRGRDAHPSLYAVDMIQGTLANRGFSKCQLSFPLCLEMNRTILSGFSQKVTLKLLSGQCAITGLLSK